MSDKLQLGAIDIETNQYVSPNDAVKEKTYRCIDCSNNVIVKKGEIRKHHFAHYAQTNTCSYYDHPNESQIHKDAKMLMAKLLKEKKLIQFIWDCHECGTSSDVYELQETPSIIHKDDDEVKIEYRDKDNKWVADVAIVNKDEVRYIIEIKHTHATTTVRPEPWYEIDAVEFIKYYNTDYKEHVEECEREGFVPKDFNEYIYTLPCLRKDICRYCYGSFCYDEGWVKKIPGYHKDYVLKNCILCGATEYLPTTDGCTGKFQNGEIRLCNNCMANDIYKKDIRRLFAPPCMGLCFRQNLAGAYVKSKCPDNCTLIKCKLCSTLKPEYILKEGMCINCNAEKYSISTKYIILLDVPFARKEEAKSLGAKWDFNRKKWYILNDNTNKDFILTKFKQI
jgi:hypothetical protein